MIKFITACIILSTIFAQTEVLGLIKDEDIQFVEACASRNISDDSIGYKAIADEGLYITNCTTLRGIETFIN